MTKALEHAIQNNISAPNKLIQSSINHIKLQDLMDVKREDNTKEKDTVKKIEVFDLSGCK